MRAVLGTGTRAILAKYGASSNLVAPDSAFNEALKSIPPVIKLRHLPAVELMEYFHSLSDIVDIVAVAHYATFEAAARRRLFRRDENDWPILAAALLLNCPIWTEDTDFFGCGVPTWTSDRIEIYLDPTSPPL